MLKHILVAALTLSSLAMAGPAMNAPRPVTPPAPRASWPVPAHPAVRPMNDDRLDALRARQLLAQFDIALKRHDFRDVQAVDLQFGRYLASEIEEARRELRFEHGRDRSSARELSRLESLSSQLASLQGRMSPRGVSARRQIYAGLAGLAQREATGGHRF